MDKTTAATWCFSGRRVPKGEIIYFSQIFVITIVIVTCIVNLSISKDHETLWTALLSSCLGYILPAPKLQNDTDVTKQQQHETLPVQHADTL